METVRIEKLVFGGQGLGVLSDGRKVFVWNALPGELVEARLIKKRRDYAEGIAERILESSAERTEPVDDAYLSTSPWQIMAVTAENTYKKEILAEVFEREGISLPEFKFASHGDMYKYRNKMEYSFWANNDGLHLALFNRGSHGKRIVDGSSIASPIIDQTAQAAVDVLNKNGIRGSQLKTIVIRSNKIGEAVAALFVKDETFPDLDFSSIGKGIAVYHSTPNSPASVITRKLYQKGDIKLVDEVAGRQITYDVNSFFQVNLPVFELALKEIKAHVSEDKITDMYAGVGTIGLAIGAHVVVEHDEHNVAMAMVNADKETKVVHASTEKALDYINATDTIVFDPPRSGLHRRVIERILEIKPPQIIYLSCNPATQARDIVSLQNDYEISNMTGYNFFPRTPHIENLVILEKR